MGGYRAFVAAVVVGFAVVFLPQSAAAQPALGLSPTTINLQGYVGADLAFVSVQVRNRGNRALKWSVAAPTANWLRISPTSGVNNGTLRVSFATSALAAGDYRASFRVDSNAGSEIVNIQVSMTASTTTSTVAPLVLSCPANMTLASSDGSSVVASYTAKTSGGAAPVSVTGSPVSGSAFPVGTTSVAVTAQSADAQTARCAFSITVNYSAPDPTPTPTTSAYGPRSAITCPAGAIDIWPGVNFQTMVNSYPGNTAFCVRAGVHYVKSSTTPKTGNTFVGEYGAILDGTGWSTTDGSAGAFMCIGGMGITNVTIRNLTIRNMPQKGIHDRDTCLNWTVENNEIHNTHWGVVATAGAVLRSNKLHHNGQGKGGGNYAIFATSRYPNTTALVENNEIAYGGDQQKALNSTAITWRNNWIHHNDFSGIWNDGEGAGSIIENNLIEDNGGPGIHWEASYKGIIRNNTVRRSVTAIYVSTSRDTLVHNNIMDGNFRGVTLYLTCMALSQGWWWNPDLSNNTIRDNAVIVPPTRSGALVSGFSNSSECTREQLAPYLSNAKSNVFQGNQYTVPSLSTGWFFWGLSDGSKTWAQWQTLPQDIGGTAKQ